MTNCWRGGWRIVIPMPQALNYVERPQAILVKQTLISSLYSIKFQVSSFVFEFEKKLVFLILKSSQISSK
jgi:hypothetical protein